MKRSEFIKLRREMAEKPIEELIEALASDDLRTRFFAEMRLRDATGV